VADLKTAVEEQARGGVPPLLMKEVYGSTKHVLFGAVVFPEDARAVDQEP
jgi:hypothetical protein